MAKYSTIRKGPKGYRWDGRRVFGGNEKFVGKAAITTVRRLNKDISYRLVPEKYKGEIIAYRIYFKKKEGIPTKRRIRR